MKKSTTIRTTKEVVIFLYLVDDLLVSFGLELQPYYTNIYRMYMHTTEMIACKTPEWNI